MESERRNGRKAGPSAPEARARGKGQAGGSGNAGKIEPDEKVLREPEGAAADAEGKDRREGASAAGAKPPGAVGAPPEGTLTPEGADDASVPKPLVRRSAPELELVGGRSGSTGQGRTGRGSPRVRGRSGTKSGWGAAARQKSGRRKGAGSSWPASSRGRDGRGVALLVVLAVSVAAYFLFTSLSAVPPDAADPGEGVGPAADGAGTSPVDPGGSDISSGSPQPGDDEAPSGAHLVDGSGGESDSVAASISPPEAESLLWPSAGRMTNGFGWVYSDTMADWRYHRGIDISAEEGEAVRSVYEGTVTDVRLDGAWGWVLEIEHSPGYSSLYAGNRRVFVERGDEVEAGQEVAQIGSTALVEGGAAPHLHFEMTWGGQIIDPLEVLVGDPP